MTDVKVAIEADSANSEEHSDARTQADRRHGIAQQRPRIKVLLTFHQAWNKRVNLGQVKHHRSGSDPRVRAPKGRSPIIVKTSWKITTSIELESSLL